MPKIPIPTYVRVTCRSLIFFFFLHGAAECFWNFGSCNFGNAHWSWNWEMGMGISGLGHRATNTPSTANAVILISIGTKKPLHLPIHSCSHEDALPENLGIRCVGIRYVGIGISGIALCSWNWEMGIGISEIGHATILPPSTGNAETLISVKAK